MNERSLSHKAPTLETLIYLFRLFSLYIALVKIFYMNPRNLAEFLIPVFDFSLPNKQW